MQRRRQQCTVWSLLCFPCTKFNIWLENLLIEKSDDEDSNFDLDYSSGKSSSSEEHKGKVEKPPKVNLREMTKEQKEDHLFVLWQRLARSLQGAIRMQQAFNQLHKRLYLEGSTRKYDFRDLKQKKPHWFIIMPKSTIKQWW